MSKKRPTREALRIARRIERVMRKAFPLADPDRYLTLNEGMLMLCMKLRGEISANHEGSLAASYKAMMRRRAKHVVTRSAVEAFMAKTICMTAMEATHMGMGKRPHPKPFGSNPEAL